MALRKFCCITVKVRLKRFVRPNRFFLKEQGIAFVELGGVEPNPKVSLVRKAIQLAKANKWIGACGGRGSVIDSSKATAVGACTDEDIWRFSLHELTPQKALPVGVILTISAAGSELSNSCVLTNSDNWLKRGFNSDIIRPLFAVMNPELTFSVSRYQTGCGIVDIMMHTLERYFTDTSDMELASHLAEGLLKAVMEAGKKAIADPNDYEARATLMLASSFSHNGLTGLGGKLYFTVHRLEHEISGMFDRVAHGAGLRSCSGVGQICLPPFYRPLCPFCLSGYGCKQKFNRGRSRLRRNYPSGSIFPANWHAGSFKRT